MTKTEILNECVMNNCFSTILQLIVLKSQCLKLKDFGLLTFLPQNADEMHQWQRHVHCQLNQQDAMYM